MTDARTQLSDEIASALMNCEDSLGQMWMVNAITDALRRECRRYDEAGNYTRAGWCQAAADALRDVIMNHQEEAAKIGRGQT